MYTIVIADGEEELRSAKGRGRLNKDFKINNQCRHKIIN